MRTIVIAMTVMFSAASAFAADTGKNMAQGEKLLNEKCMTCHKTEVYTRSDRRITSLPALKHQVENCMKGPAEANWSAKETDAVIDYLNQKFYKF